ncbi:MAG: ester cyclase [Gemmatimonadota bacterium]
MMRTVLVVVAGFWPSAVVAQQPENAERFAAFLEMVNSHDLGRLEQLVSEDFVRHSQATSGVTIASRADYAAFLEADFVAVPDSHVECPMTAGEGDLLAVWCVYAGTQEGFWGPFPPSGRRIELEFASFLRFRDGKIAEMWITWDNVAALTQLGHLILPIPEETP